MAHHGFGFLWRALCYSVSCCHFACYCRDREVGVSSGSRRTAAPLFRSLPSGSPRATVARYVSCRRRSLTRIVSSPLDAMTESVSSRVLRAALFILVPAAYLSMGFWRPASSYGPTGRIGVSPFCAVLMAAVFLVCLCSWSRYRIVAALGFIACLFWLVVALLPVL